MFSRFRSMLTIGLISILPFASSTAQKPPDPLLKGFEDPPQSARPLVWWHWMNGNVTEEGIKLDLRWMHRIGLGGFQTFDAAVATPQVVKTRLVYMTPAWKDAFRYAIDLGNRYGMQMAIAGSPGWSESGGPWVAPADGMKKYVWSETIIGGGKLFAGKLATPPAVTGPFQNLPLDSSAGSKPAPQDYADSVVVAYRQPKADIDAALDVLDLPDTVRIMNGELAHGERVAGTGMKHVKALAGSMYGKTHLCCVPGRGGQANTDAMAVLPAGCDMKWHSPELMPPGREVNEVKFRVVNPSRHSIGACPCVAIRLGAEIDRRELCRRPLRLLSAQDAGEKITMLPCNRADAFQNVDPILHAPVLKTTAR